MYFNKLYYFYIVLFTIRERNKPMTKIKVSIRDYRFSDGKLKQEGDKVSTSVTRDIIEFNARGVTDTTVTDFITMIEDFDNLPTDVELQGDVMVATEKKDNGREVLSVAIKTIRTMAENTWGAKAPKLRIYGVEGMDDMTDNDLHRCGKRVIRVATAQLADLAAEGLTIGIITDLSTKNLDFDERIDFQQDRIQVRDIATQTRIDSGNVVYKEMMRLCNIGKDIWASVNEAKYNDYVIYNTPGGLPPVPPVVPGP